MESSESIRERVKARMATGTTTTRKPAAKKTSPKPKAAPNTVSPGWVHKAIAANILKTIRDNSEAQFGRPLDVGELPETEELAREGGIIDDRTPLELLSRIIAHIFHRTPGLSKVEKRLEGNQRSSGIMSDVSAFFLQLYARNESLIKEVKETVEERSRARQQASSNGGTGSEDASVPLR